MAGSHSELLCFYYEINSFLLLGNVLNTCQRISCREEGTKEGIFGGFQAHSCQSSKDL